VALYIGTSASIDGHTQAQGYSASTRRSEAADHQKERDIETGLEYFGAHYYASTHGRFTRMDNLLNDWFSIRFKADCHTEHIES
jgi:hypothetical protein